MCALEGRKQEICGVILLIHMILIVSLVLYSQLEKLKRIGEKWFQITVDAF